MESGLSELQLVHVQLQLGLSELQPVRAQLQLVRAHQFYPVAIGLIS
jgi:hypothetical protein